MSEVNAWRNSRLHRRCTFCKHLKHRGGLEFGYWVCNAKDKLYTDLEVLSPRPFCKLFSLREVEADA